MKVLAEFTDRVDSCICDIPTLGEHEVSEPRCYFYDLLDSSIGESCTAGKI